ncbi:MAG TPA: ribosome maturation factor RimM [Polyangiaceae bacterium]|nr:ribosome maturation factor RimM [Polyangiaceae bacterium]
MLAPDAWVPLAQVMRPHGVRGELRLCSFNRDSDLLLSLDEVLVRFADGDEQEVSVDGARRANDAILVKLHSVDSREKADGLRGAVVCARRSDFPPPEDGEFYACDVEGARVVVDSGPELGRVTELKTYPTVDVLVVTATDGGRPWEVPLVDAVVTAVDLEGGLVTLASMDGVERA